jgi:hypothetical protein
MSIKTLEEDPTVVYRDAYIDLFNNLIKNAYENLEFIVRREKAGKKASGEAKKLAETSERWLRERKGDYFRLPYHTLCDFLGIDSQQTRETLFTKLNEFAGYKKFRLD